MRRWLIFGAILFTFAARAEDFSRYLDHHFKLPLGTNAVRFNPAKAADLRRMERQIDQFLLNPEPDGKHLQRGLEEIRRLAKSALAETNSTAREQIEMDLAETVLAVNNLDRSPLPRHFDVISAPVAVQQLVRPIGIGARDAVDLEPNGAKDLSRVDPLPSGFWKRPADIASEDLYHAFGRAALPEGLPGEMTQLCHYAEAKESSGMNPGYEVNWGGERVKLKFGEQSSEPVVTRFFWALGFNADPTDYSAGVKVAYDRRIFTEFNSRHPVETTFTVFWFIPVYTMNLQRTNDPFNYVASAVLRDGRKWTGAELKAHLLTGTNFNPAVEAQIDYLVTTPANVQARDPEVKSIGPWDYGQLDHADRREIRGAGLLAAWLGFYDTRFDNTKVRLVGPKKHARVVHYFSDLGGGLGQATGFVSWHGENVNDFAWRFTAPPEPPSKGHPWRPLRIVNYSPIVPTPAFEQMTIDDARWMARLIGQLRAGQIRQALEASGYDAPTVALYVKKLITRRNQMMKDFRMDQEFPPLSWND
jgi:hypothetical protein